jgi:FAD/FMN-containing dehydrogenase
MSTTIQNYDGSILTTPQELVRPQSVEEIQSILKQRDRYPGPVRAMGSFHSLTPCPSSTGTIVDMRGMDKLLRIDRQTMTFTAQAGMEMIEANRLLRKEKLQFILNIEIGNLTLGSAACCQTKDSLDAVELGQVNSYVTGIKWVNPQGGLEEASEDKNPELLPLIRSSYGLAGIVYEVTFRIKPLEIVSFDYDVRPIAELTQAHIDSVMASNQCMVCWTIDDTVIVQTRNQATELKHEWLAGSRRFSWNFLGAFSSRVAGRLASATPLSTVLEDVGFDIEIGFYRLASKLGGFTLHAPDKMVDYSKTPRIARYAFTFWAFPKDQWVENIKAYVQFRDDYFRLHGFRCNLPCGAYFIRRDRSSLLSYTYDGDTISIDPIHAPGERDKEAWPRFLEAFNEWSFERGGIPLLNQSPFVTREHVQAAYGERWTRLCEWLKSVDPDRRMVNEFFAALM